MTRPTPALLAAAPLLEAVTELATLRGTANVSSSEQVLVKGDPEVLLDLLTDPAVPETRWVLSALVECRTCITAICHWASVTFSCGLLLIRLPSRRII
jgi:hypothetical protein